MAEIYEAYTESDDLDEWEAQIDDEEEEQWESESLCTNALEGVADTEPSKQSGAACTPEEAKAFRKQLRAVGGDHFVKGTVEAGTITAKRLCTAFGIPPPAFLEGAPDSAYYPLLSLAISRELSKRVKLPQYNTVDDAVDLLKNSNNIIVLTGAGISTSLGIPDFRSKDTGLYAKLEHLGLSDPQEVFDIELFREDPSIFYSIAKDILPTTERYSPTHAFIHLLQQKGKLLTNYSQNIDNLEGKAGIMPEKLIQCHGSFATATCVVCKYTVPCEDIFSKLKEGNVVYCSRCTKESTQLQADGLKRKRNSRQLKNKSTKKKRWDEDARSEDEEKTLSQAGVMKPDITFFGEALPSTFHDRLLKHDRDLVDLVIVIGTSLKVAPVSEVVGILPIELPQIYISRTPVSHVDFDIELLGDCDVVVAELCRRAGWELSHEMIPENEKVDVQLQDGYQSRHVFSARSD